MNTETIAPLLNEAEQYLSTRDFDRAAALYVRAKELDADRSPIPTVGLARIAMCMGRLDDARTLVDRVLARHPKCAWAYLVAGAVSEAQGEFDAARNAYARAVINDAQFGLAHFNLARAVSRSGNWAAARACAERAAQCMPKNPDALSLAAQCAYRLGDVSAALAWSTQAVAVAPDSAQAVAALADALVEAGKLELAARTLDNGLVRLPEVPMLHSKRAAVAIRSDDVAAALRHTVEVIRLEPKNHDAKLLAAVLCSTQGDLVQAIRHAQAVLVDDPSNDRAHFQLGMIFDSLGHRPAADQSYRRAITEPTQWAARVNLALLLLEAGAPRGYREATALLEAALTLAPANERPRVQYNLALAYARTQEPKRAKTFAMQAAATASDDVIRRDAAGLLKELSTW